MKKKRIHRKAESPPGPSRWLQLPPVLAGIFFSVLPFVVSFAALDKFRAPKEIFVVAGVVVLAASYLLTRQLELPRRLDPWTWILLAALLYTGVHARIVGDSGAAVRGWWQLVCYSVLLLVLAAVLSPDLQKKLWLAIGLTMSVNAVVTIFQYFGRFPLMEGPGGSLLEGRMTPAGFVGEVNSGAFLFGLVVIVAAYGVVVEKDWRIRLAAGAILAFNLAGLLFTRTLTALAALAVAAALWMAFHHWWTLKKARRGARGLVYFWIVLAIGLSIGAGVAYKAEVFSRVKVVYNLISQGYWTAATAGRQPVFLITWEMIKERPWTGRGLNSFGLEFFSYRANTEYGRSLTLIDQPGAFREAHNEYLQIWEELGIVGLAIFAALFFLPVWGGIRFSLTRAGPADSYWSGLLAIAGVYVAVASLTFFPFHLAATAAYVTLLVACLRNLGKGDDRPEESSWPIEERMPSWGRRIGKPVAVAAVALFILNGQAALWTANREMGIAAFLLEQANSMQAEARRLRVLADEALTRLEKAGDRGYRLREAYNLKGSANMLLGRYEEAIRNYEKASSYLPSPEVYTNLAAAYMAAGESSEARPFLEQALNYNPAYKPAREALDHLDRSGGR